VPQQQLHGPQVLGATINQRGFGSSKRMRSVTCPVQANLLDPCTDDPGVLPSGQMARAKKPAWKQSLLWAEAGIADPGRHGRARGFGDFELYWPLRLLLQHDGACRDRVAMTYVAHTQFHEVTRPQLTVDRQVEQREFPASFGKLQTYTDRPDFLQSERGLLTDQLALVPGLATSTSGAKGFRGLSPFVLGTANVRPLLGRYLTPCGLPRPTASEQ
jgi:hypothetical protein